MTETEIMNARMPKLCSIIAFWLATTTVVCLPHSIQAQAPTAGTPRRPGTSDRVVMNSGSKTATDGRISPQLSVCPPDHPLRESLNYAYEAWEQMASIQDYSCRFVKRERIDGKLAPHEFLFLKIRHEPFSVYLYALGPHRNRGDEAIYVEGLNNGMVLAHTSGIRDRIAGTVELQPTSPRLMDNNLYPLTNIGMQNLLRKLINFQEYESRFGECEVNVYPDVKVDGRACDCVQVVHPVPRRNFKFYMLRVYYDQEYKIPIRFEAFSWPQQPGGEPVLIEEYTYMDLKLNRKLTDADFDANNPQYGFH